jgi:hypothetical protein
MPAGISVQFHPASQVEILFRGQVKPGELRCGCHCSTSADCFGPADVASGTDSSTAASAKGQP